MELTKLSIDSVNTIKKNWFLQLDELEDDGSYLYSSVERIVDWCEKSVGGAEHCLFSLNDDSSVRAVVEIADASKSKDPSFKFLNIYLEPSLIVDYKDEVRQEDLEEPIAIIAFALLESLKMALENGTTKLKVYARTDEMKNLFDSLVLTANETADKSNAEFYRQGRWLVIETKKR